MSFVSLVFRKNHVESLVYRVVEGESVENRAVNGDNQNISSGMSWNMKKTGNKPKNLVEQHGYGLQMLG